MRPSPDELVRVAVEALKGTDHLRFKVGRAAVAQGVKNLRVGVRESVRASG